MNLHRLWAYPLLGLTLLAGFYACLEQPSADDISLEEFPVNIERPTESLQRRPLDLAAALVGSWTYSPCSEGVTSGVMTTLIFRADGSYSELRRRFNASCRPVTLISRRDGVFSLPQLQLTNQSRDLSLLALRAQLGTGHHPEELTPPVVTRAHLQLNGDVLGFAIDSDSGAAPGSYSKQLFPYQKTRPSSAVSSRQIAAQ